jgi:hypothetical protein
MNTRPNRSRRVAAAVAVSVGSLLLAGTTSAVPTQPARRTVSGIHVRTHATWGLLTLRENQTPCRNLDGACSIAAERIAHNGAGGRVTYR